LLIQYIRSYSSYLEAVSSIRNPKTRHAVVTGTHKTCRTICELQWNKTGSNRSTQN